MRLGRRLAMPLWVRPNLAAPDHAVISVTALSPSAAVPYGHNDANFTAYADIVPGQPGAWLRSSGPVTAAGQATGTTPAGVHGNGSRSLHRLPGKPRHHGIHPVNWTPLESGPLGPVPGSELG